MTDDREVMRLEVDEDQIAKLVRCNYLTNEIPHPSDQRAGDIEGTTTHEHNSRLTQSQSQSQSPQEAAEEEAEHGGPPPQQEAAQQQVRSGLSRQQDVA